MVVQHLRERRVGPIEVSEVRTTQASANAMKTSRKPCVVAEEHLALTVDLPTDRREPGNGVPRRPPRLFGTYLLAQGGRCPGQGNEALPWHLLLGAAAPETASVSSV